MASNLYIKEKWVSKPIQVRKSLQWKIHNISETHHLNTWPSLGLTVDIPTSPETLTTTPTRPPLAKDKRLSSTFSFSREPAEELPLSCNDFSAKVLQWNLSLLAAEDGSDLLARVLLLNPPNCTLTYKVTVKIGRPGQLPLCPTMSQPREIQSGGAGQNWRILPLEQLCSPTNGLISEDSLELFIDLVCFGSRAEGENGQVQYQPAQWNQGAGAAGVNSGMANGT